MLLLLLRFLVDGLNAVRGLLFHIVLEYSHHALPIIILERHSIIVLLLPDNENVWEFPLVFKLLLVEMHLPLVDHHYSLLVVVRVLVFDNYVVGITDNCNDEVHENHEKVEHGYDEQEPCEVHDQWAVDVVAVFVNDVEGCIAAEKVVVAHRATEDHDEVREDAWESTVRIDVNSDDVVALCES